MKHTWKVLGAILCLMLLLPFALGACGGNDDPAKALIGIWTDENGMMEYEFKSDGVMVIRFMGEEIEMPFTLSDGKITATDPETGEANEVDYRIEGDNLILSFEGEEETLVRKQE